MRIQSTKSFIPVKQMQSASYSSGLSREQLIRIRADQKQLFGPIIDGNVKRSTKNGTNNGEECNETADLKAFAPSQVSEFHWLIQRSSNKNVKIYRSKEVEIDEDVSTVDKFENSSGNNTS